MNDYEVLNILMLLFSTQILRIYLSAFHNQKRASGSVKWMAWGIYIFFQYWVVISGASQPLFILILNIGLIFSIYKSSYYVNSRTALFLSGILYAFWMLVEVITNNFLYLTDIDEYSYFFVVGSAISKIIMYMAVHLLKRFRKSSLYTNMPLHYWLRLFLIPVATFYIIHNTYCLTFENNNNVFFTITTILMILINYITFDVYDKLGNNLEIEKRNLAYEQQIALCNKQAAERETSYQETRRIRHDLKDYLIDLKVTLKNGNLNDTLKKIDYMLEQNQIYKNEVSRSGNLVVDSLINYKYSLAQKEGIDMKCYIFVPEEMVFAGADLCIILGNLIDNAMEAVNGFLPGQRYIDVSVTQIKDSLSIMVKNPYKGKLLLNGNGQIITSKQNRRNHGIGLDSVQRTVDKYKGELLIEHEDGIFSVSILLFPPKNLHSNS